MGLIVKEFHCDDCNDIFEDLVETKTSFAPCPTCGQPCEKILSAPFLGQMNDPQKRNEALRKRAHEHTLKEMKKDPTPWMK